MTFMLEPFEGESALFPHHLPFSFLPTALPTHKGESGVEIYEHKNNIIVEAAVPGIGAQNVNVKYERGVLTIEAKKSEESTDKEKRYFQKSSSSFIYHLHVPGHIDEKIEPTAEVSHGVIKVTFVKQKAGLGSKLINVKTKGKEIPHKPVISSQKGKKLHKKS